MNNKKLRKLIKQRGDGYFAFAKKYGMQPLGFVLKLYGIGEFRLWEINRIANGLNLETESTESIFLIKKFPKGNK